MKRFLLLVISCMVFIAVLPAQAAYTYDAVFVTSQRYDRGEMIWRSDIGEILILANDGQVMRYSVFEYGALPPNPWRLAPIGKIPPMMGFGKVWANYDEVRAKLGWAYISEVGRDTPITGTDDGSVYLLDQSARPVRIASNNTWGFVDSIPDTRINPPQNDPTIQSFSVSPDVVASGQTITVNWNMANVDGAIVEMYYDLPPNINQLHSIQDFQPSIGTTTFTVPDLGWDSIKIVVHGVRYDTDRSGRRLTGRVVSASESIVVDDETPPDEIPQIQEFTVSPDVVNAGETITIAWDLLNVDGAHLEIYDAYPRNDILYAIEDNQPASGSMTFTVPEQTLHGMTVTIYGINYETSNGRENPIRVMNATEVINLAEVLPEPIQKWAVYQAYDNGMMLWQSDTGLITVLFDDGTVRNYPLPYYAYLADAPSDVDVPDGKVLPTNGFGRVWVYLDGVRDQLGWATDTETGYNLTITTLESGALEYNLPDGTTIYLQDNTWSREQSG